jgi:hypothetical protein
MYRFNGRTETGLDTLRWYLNAKGGQPAPVRDTSVGPQWSWYGSQKMAAGDVSATIAVVEANIRYAVFLSTNWPTNIWWTSKTLTGFSIAINTEAPSSAVVDFGVISWKSTSPTGTSPQGSVDDVPETSGSISLTLDEPDTQYRILGSPNWNTSWGWSDKTRTSVTITFANEAPSGAKFDWVPV